MIARFFAILLFIVFLAAAVFGVVELARSPLIGLPVVAAGIGGMWLVIRFDRQREIDCDRAERQRAARRTAAILGKVEQPEFRMVVHGSSGLLPPLLGMLPLAALLLFIGQRTRDYWLLASGAVLGYLAVVMVLRFLPRHRNALLELNADGFKTPATGWLPWSQVADLSLINASSRGMTTHVVRFRIVEPAVLDGQLHPLERISRVLLFGYGRDQINVLLRNATVPPEAVSMAASILHARHRQKQLPAMADERR